MFWFELTAGWRSAHPFNSSALAAHRVGVEEVLSSSVGSSRRGWQRPWNARWRVVGLVAFSSSLQTVSFGLKEAGEPNVRLPKSWNTWLSSSISNVRLSTVTWDASRWHNPSPRGENRWRIVTSTTNRGSRFTKSKPMLSMHPWASYQRSESFSSKTSVNTTSYLMSEIISLYLQ